MYFEWEYEAVDNKTQSYVGFSCIKPEKGMYFYQIAGWAEENPHFSFLFFFLHCVVLGEYLNF